MVDTAQHLTVGVNGIPTHEYSHSIMFVMDYERAMWDTASFVFPNTTRQCCTFHFSQAIWRKGQDLGLVVPYRNNDGIQDLVHQIMALPFLPAEHALSLFQDIQSQTPEGPCQDLLRYYHSTWIVDNWLPRDCPDRV